MRATGIVRRIDDLGRVVIPKEIRRNMGIKEGDPLEIYTDNTNGIPMVCFQKYSVSADYDYETLGGILKIAAGGHPFVLCNADGEVVTDNKDNFTDDQIPTDHTFNVRGYDIAFLSTTADKKGEQLANMCRIYFEQYED